MFLDQALKLSDAQAITVTAASTSLYDVTGAGAGNVPNMIFGTTGLAGVDIGLGDSAARPTAYFTVGTTFTAAGAATLQIQLQAAVDNGAGSPGAYVTISETSAIAVALLVAGANLQMPIPPLTIGQDLPRFYRFNYVVATGPMTAGTLTGAILLNAPTQTNVQYPANFVAV
jgi:hypothetical protein